jgi:hypothetical protein
MTIPSIFPDLIVIVVNYKLKQDTIDCLHSLLSANAILQQVIVVDNHSDDGSVEAFREEFGSALEVIVSPENKGYPHALNVGIPRAIEKGAKWVLLMNNDTLVAPDFITELQRAACDNPQYALIGPMILYHAEPKTIWYLGYRALPGTLIGVGSYRGYQDKGQFPSLVPIDFMHGCAMMVRADVFQKIGFFDDTHIIYGDDADFSWRARRAGFKMGAATRAKMWHKIARTMGRQKPRTRYLRIRNTIFFYRRYSNWAQMIIMVLFTFMRMVVLILGDLVHHRTDLIVPLMHGWADGWSNRTVTRY